MQPNKEQSENNRKNEEKYRDIIHDAPIAIYEVDFSGSKVRAVNPAVSQMIGYSEQELLEMNPLDLLVGDSKKKFYELVNEALAGRAALFSAEYVVKTKNGETIWALLDAKVNYKDGKPDTVHVFAREITERKKSEEALKESVQLYRTLFDNSEDGFILLEPIFDENGKACDFRFLTVNRAYEKQTNTKAANVMGKRAREVVPNLEPNWVALCGNVSQTGKSVHYENYNQRTNRWYDAYYFPYTKSQVGILFRDITEHKKAEEALRVEKERFESLADSLPEIIFETDINGKIVYANKSGFEITGYTEEDLAKGFDVFSLIATQDKEKAVEYFKKMLNKKPTPYYEFTATRKDGSTFPVIISGRLVVGKEGPVGLRGIVIDITDRKKAEEALKDNERLAAIGATAGMVGHDLRNPLQTIVSELYLAKTEIKEVPESQQKVAMQESLESIAEQVDYMDKIVSDLQTFVKPVEPQTQLIELKPLITALVTQIDIPKDIQANIQVQKALTAEVDPQLLKRVLINLVTNAVQAMPDGGELTIKTQTKDKEHVQIMVEDTGIGIPEGIRDKIFSPLFTTKSKGQGFGLAVCKRVIEAQNGTITFESEEGKGTKFTIELPLSN
jgi:PAS domain S-box-containing protein